MDRKYSILILSLQGKMRRLVFSRTAFKIFLCVSAIALSLSIWFVRDYLVMKARETEVAGLLAKMQAHRVELSGLHERTQHLKRLLANWKGLRQKVEASLPAHLLARNHSTNGVKDLENNLVLLQKDFEFLIASIPNEWPVNGRVSSGLGTRLDPWTGQPEFHAGIDVPGPMGTPVYAPGDGVVEAVGYDNGSGRTVVLNHGQGITTVYRHLSRIDVKRGQLVRKSQQIAAVGNTGRSTSAHLHYEVRVNGSPVDPRRHILR